MQIDSAAPTRYIFGQSPTPLQHLHKSKQRLTSQSSLSTYFHRHSLQLIRHFHQQHSRWDDDLPAAIATARTSPSPSRGTTVVCPTPRYVLDIFSRRRCNQCQHHNNNAGAGKFGQKGGSHQVDRRAQASMAWNHDDQTWSGSLVTVGWIPQYLGS